MRRIAIGALILIALAFCSTLRAAQPPATAPADPQKVQEFLRLEKELAELFPKKDFKAIGEVCRKQIELFPKAAEPHYNLACSMARLGEKEPAFKELAVAVDLGFVDADHINTDDDLVTLHDDPRFKDLVAKARDKRENAPHEKGAEIAGIKTVEGFPEQGLRYRLRIDPAASEAKPARLIIWLHPSGGSMDNVVEAMSPQFAKDGYAVVVFTQKDYRFWSPLDANALMNKTLPDIAKIKGVDAKKPILLGFSAGGQLALQMWETHPEMFGGLVVDAAYPLSIQAMAAGRVAPLNLPKNEAIKSCPILALVGGADGGSNLWRAVAKSWLDSKVPLTIHIIPGKGHAWLIDKTEGAALHDWLKKVAAGKLPADKAPPAGPQTAPATEPARPLIRV